MPQDRLMRLPFAFEAEVVFPPKRLPTLVHLQDSVDVTVASVEPGDAPVAFVLRRDDIDRRWADLGKPRPEPTLETYRTYEGKLFRPMGADAVDFEADAADRACWRSRWPGHSAATRRPGWSGHSYPLEVKCANSLSTRFPMALPDWEEIKADDPKAKALSSTREARMAEAAVALPQRLLVVGGQMWVALRDEPHWTVHMDANDQKVAVGLRFSAREPLAYLFPFALDRLGSARSFAEVIAKAKGWRLEEPDAAVEMLVPDALRLDEGVLCLAQLAACRGVRDRAAISEDVLEVLGRIGSRGARGVVDIESAAAMASDIATLESTGDLDAMLGERGSDRDYGWFAYERWTTLREGRPDLAADGDLDADDLAALRL